MVEDCFSLRTIGRSSPVSPVPSAITYKRLTLQADQHDAGNLDGTVVSKQGSVGGRSGHQVPTKITICFIALLTLVSDGRGLFSHTSTRVDPICPRAAVSPLPIFTRFADAVETVHAHADTPERKFLVAVSLPSWLRDI